MRQTITWTNANLLSIGPLGTNFRWHLNQNTIISINKCIWIYCLQNGGDFMMALSNKSFFRVTGPLRGHRWIPLSRASNADFDCLLDRLFRLRSKKTSGLRVTAFCKGNPSVTAGFPSQRARNVENVSIWWRLYEVIITRTNADLLSIFSNVNFNSVLIQMSPMDPSDNKLALVQVMSCRLLGAKPLPKPMLANYCHLDP